MLSTYIGALALIQVSEYPHASDPIPVSWILASVSAVVGGLAVTVRVVWSYALAQLAARVASLERENERLLRRETDLVGQLVAASEVRLKESTQSAATIHDLVEEVRTLTARRESERDPKEG